MVTKTFKIAVREVPLIQSSDCPDYCIFHSLPGSMCNSIKCTAAERADRTEVYFIAESISEQE